MNKNMDKEKIIEYYLEGYNINSIAEIFSTTYSNIYQKLKKSKNEDVLRKIEMNSNKRNLNINDIIEDIKLYFPKDKQKIVEKYNIYESKVNDIHRQYFYTFRDYLLYNKKIPNWKCDDVTYMFIARELLEQEFNKFLLENKLHEIPIKETPYIETYNDKYKGSNDLEKKKDITFEKYVMNTLPSLKDEYDMYMRRNDIPKVGTRLEYLKVEIIPSMGSRKATLIGYYNKERKEYFFYQGEYFVDYIYVKYDDGETELIPYDYWYKRCRIIERE